MFGGPRRAAGPSAGASLYRRSFRKRSKATRPSSRPSLPIPDAETIGGHLGDLRVVHARRQHQHALGVEKAATEVLDVAALVPREADAAAGGRLPVEEVGPAAEEVGEQRPVGGDDAAVALPDRLAVPECDGREVLRRSRIADRGVVLALLHALQQGAVAARKPADAQAGQPVGLGHHVERDRGLGEVRGLCERPRRIDLDAPVDLVGEQPDAALVAERHELPERASFGT